MSVAVNSSEAALWPLLGPAVSFNWVSLLPLLPNIPLGALGNIPWFAADCPAPRSLRCGQSGRRPGGRGLGRQRPGTLRSTVAQEVVGGTNQQWKATGSHLVDKELHLSAVLHGSVAGKAVGLCLPLSYPSRLCPWTQELQATGWMPPWSLCTYVFLVLVSLHSSGTTLGLLFPLLSTSSSLPNHLSSRPHISQSSLDLRLTYTSATSTL